MKTAFIAGITGQDGFYLSKLLQEKGYRVVGISDQVEGGGEGPIIISADIRDTKRLREILNKYQPDEFYNLAGVTDLGLAARDPELTLDLNYRAVGQMFNLALNSNPKIKIFQASSAEMFDKSVAPQSETTTFKPTNSYGEAKLRAYQEFVVGSRKQGVFVCSGFLFNHESPRRDLRFVTRKITHSIAELVKGKRSYLEIGNLDAKRDWSFAGDIVEGMWRMLQATEPDDYVLASGATHTVREFVEVAASAAGLKLSWRGQGLEEIARNSAGRVIIKINKDFYRPETAYPLGDITKAKAELGWEPRISFPELVQMMVLADLDRI